MSYRTSCPICRTPFWSRIGKTVCDQHEKQGYSAYPVTGKIYFPGQLEEEEKLRKQGIID